MNKTCLICSSQSVGYIRNEELGSNSSIPNGKVISFQLGKILGISIQNLNKINAQNQFDRIVYCPTCLERILYIQDILQELERLQKTLEHEKLLIESQLKESAKDVKHFQNRDLRTHDDEIYTRQIRTEFVIEMQQSTLSSGFHKNQIVSSDVMTDQNISEEIRDVSRLEFQIFDLDHDIKSEFEIVDESNEPTSSDSDPLALQCSDNQNYSVETPTPFVVPKANTNTMNENKRKKCELCEKTFKNGNGLRNHVLIVHDKMYKFGCNICSYNCQSSTVLELHMKSHTNDDFQCTRCPKKFYSKKLFSIHLKIEHGVLPRRKRYNKRTPTKCDDCGKILSSRITWKNHVLSVHKREFKYKCQICDYGCQFPYNFNLHMITHKND